MTLSKKFLQTYCRTLLIVLAIDVISNLQHFQSGKTDWRISFLYIGSIVTAGFLIFVPLNTYYLNRFLDWQRKPARSFLIFIILAAAIGGTLEVIFKQMELALLHDPGYSLKAYSNDILLSAAIFVAVALSTTFREFLDRWRQHIEAAARTEQLLLKSQFESLKNQVNPHFLFNSLNTLAALIREDEEKAVDFVQQLSRIMRYALEQQDNGTSTLQDELKIARSYLRIFKHRYHDKLNYEIDIPDASLQRQVVCHSLIMLLENAIKHNEISQQRPLLIRIFEDGDWIAVENNLQPRKMPEPSNHIGLANIRERYKLVTDLPVVTDTHNQQWSVKIPLL